MHKEQGDVKERPELMRISVGNNKAEQREGNQGYRGQNARRRGGNRGRPRGGSRGVPRGGFVQGQGDNPEFSDWVMGDCQGWGDGPGDAFHPQRGYGTRGCGDGPGRLSSSRGYGTRGCGDGPGDAFHPQRGYGTRGCGDGPGDAFQPQRGYGSRGSRGWGDGPGDAFHPQRGYGTRGWGDGPGDAFQPQRGYGSRGSRGWGDGPGDAFQPQRGHGSRGGRGNQPKPKPKPNNRGRGYRGRDQHFQQPEGFQGSQQFSYDDRESQFTQRQRYPERGGNQARGKNVAPVLLSDLARGNAHRVCDDSDSGRHLRGLEPSRRGQGNRGRPRDSGNRGRGQTRMTRAQSSSSVEGARGDQRADTGENVGKQSRFERNKLLVCELSESTTNDGVVNFIEAMSGGEEVKEVLMLSNGSALVTMVNDITNFSRIKTKGEKRGLDSAQLSIEQVPVCTSILVSGISDNTTHDAIELHFESHRNSGGPVERVQFVPNSGRAVVVFQDPKGSYGKVLARHEEKPHVLNKAQLSIRIYHEFLEGEDGDEPAGGLEPSADSADKTQVSQQSKAKTQQLHIAVDPDVMEFVTTTAFRDQLSKSLAVKKSEITWKINNKMAVIVYLGKDDSDSWQTECIDEVQNYLGKFTKCDVQVNKEFWEVVVAQLSSIRACLGVDPPLIKTIEDSSVARIVSLSADVKDYEEKLKSKLEEIYREETRKSYVKKKEHVPEERLILLKKIKFVEKLQEKNKELEIKLDTEGEEIYFEGPQPQFKEATMKFRKQISDMVEKKLTLSNSILEVLASDEGLMKVKCELEKNNVEAVFVIDKDARIVGTSAAHADNAARLVNKLMLEEKVLVDDRSKYLLKSPEWRQLCDEMNTGTAVRIHRNNWNDTYLAGFRDDVTEVMKKLNIFLESNCIREEQFTCTSKIVRRYLAELCQEDLRSIENQLKDCEVKIQKGKGDDDFDISGNKEGLARVRKKLDALADGTVSKTFDVKQPGLRKYFDSGKENALSNLWKRIKTAPYKSRRILVDSSGVTCAPKQRL
ncbi:hypothetical protein OS493_035525 [Desmophyllum pertusum]|uniref:Uncharacterized protein n=1 Tax=Desmophyllum pertusum TaxID=174260 RepID=A0A9X0CJV0_9CNID|nr:hypothetical protein OS493_035525 [Desmophyllum pertusum]